MRPIRVLRILARLNVGGPALEATVLARGLDPTRFEQRLVSGRVGDDEGDFVALRAPDLAVHYIDSLGRAPASADITALRALRAEIRSFRPDVVHTHTTKAGLLGRMAAWSAGVPVTIHTFHGHHLHGYFSPVVRAALVTTERALAWRTTALVAGGVAVRDELLAARIGRRDQYTVVPPGLDRLAVVPRDRARSELGLPRDGDVVAYVARLTGVKRPDRFAEVALALAARRPATRFIVAGEGELLADLRERTMALGDRILFLGWRSDVETVYGAADVVLLTSDNEGMPVSLIEAAMCGRPAVSTRVGSTGEVVLDGQTGFTVERSVPALTDAVDTLLRDPERRGRMGEAAAAHAHAHFSESRLVADIAALYERVVRTRETTRGRTRGRTDDESDC